MLSPEFFLFPNVFVSNSHRDQEAPQITLSYRTPHVLVVKETNRMLQMYAGNILIQHPQSIQFLAFASKENFSM